MSEKIIWLTGGSGSGKTTIARELAAEIGAVILDGDEMRDSISLGAGFTRADRRDHNLKVARLAGVLARQVPVVVAVIAPMADVRAEIDRICAPAWVYCQRPLPDRPDHFYEPPKKYFTIQVDHDTPAAHAARVVAKFAPREKYSLFIGRWQPLHPGHMKLIDHVRREGRKIAVGIRNTARDLDNPHTVSERAAMIREAMPDARIVVVPDIDEIVYGREVGYKFREIRLDAETEKISGTSIRAEGR